MNHLEQLQKKVAEYKLDGMLITSESGEFYALGLRCEAMLLVTPTQCHLATDGRYIEAAEAQKEKEGLSQLIISKTEPRRTRLTLTRDFILQNGIRELGIEGEYLSLTDYRRYEKELPSNLIDTQVILKDLRGVKTAEELATMKEAQKITDAAFTEILNFVQEGRTEEEISAQLAFEMAKRGGLELAFPIIVACGTNGSRPHALAGKRVLEKGQFVTMDFGCKFEGYCSDMTRTIAIGQPTEEMEKVYHTVLKAQETALSSMKAGQTGAEIDGFARNYLTEAGYGEYFAHSLGHSLGIEIHEKPNASSTDITQLPAGVVLSVEPGIYIPGKFGVRIEDVVILTQDGCENITSSTKELLCF